MVTQLKKLERMNKAEKYALKHCRHLLTNYNQSSTIRKELDLCKSKVSGCTFEFVKRINGRFPNGFTWSELQQIFAAAWYKANLSGTNLGVK